MSWTRIVIKNDPDERNFRAVCKHIAELKLKLKAVGGKPVKKKEEKNGIE